MIGTRKKDKADRGERTCDVNVDCMYHPGIGKGCTADSGIKT